MLETIRIELGERSYDINIGSGIMKYADKYFDLDRKVAVITDSGVPKEYSEAIKGAAREAKVITFPMGEESKSLATYAKICEELLEFNLQRGDAIVSVGGGVCSDIAGFIAATYMRGVDFYTVPTTTLAATDASVGGKNGIDFCLAYSSIGSSRINPLCENATRIATFSYDKNFEEYVVNKLDITVGKEIENVVITPNNEKYKLLIYGVYGN